MKKRSFYSLIILLPLTGLILTSISSCKTSSRSKTSTQSQTTAQSKTSAPGKNIGLQLYSIRDSITKNVPAAIAKVANMGYKFVEPAGYGNGKIYGMEPAAFKALCEANKMTVLSAHVSRNVPDSTNMEETMAWWDACIDAHVAAGAKFLIQPTMGGTAYESLAGLKAYCDYFNAVGEKCNAKGIRFGFHNHNKEFSTKLDGQTIYDFMLANTDPSKVMFQVDLGHMVDGGADPLYYFNKYPGRFELWHIAEGYEIGSTGKLDYKAIWAAAAKAGLQYGIVEVERYHFDEFTSCQKSIDFLNAAPYVVMPK